MLAITMVVGAGVFGYVNQQAGVSAQQYGSSAGATVNYLQERFVPVEMNFAYNFPAGCTTHCESSTITVYVYNNGNILNNFQQIEVYNGTRSKIDLTFTATAVTNVNSGCKITSGISSVENPVLGTGSGTFSVSTGSIGSVTLTVHNSCYSSYLDQGDTYYVNVLGIYGNVVTYFQVM
jgi:hypothetical protein